jgi:hypothetical protein
MSRLYLQPDPYLTRTGSGGAGASAVLNNVDYTFGTWTFPTGGRVALDSPTLTSSVSGLPLVDPSSAAIVTWALVSVDTGTAGHFNSAVDIAAGNTPSILAAGYKTSGLFIITIRGTAANGTQDTCQITITRDATKCTLGDTGDNFDYNVINSAGNVAVAGGFTGFLIATGVTSTREFGFNPSFAFTAPVTIEYADITRKTVFSSVNIAGCANLSGVDLETVGTHTGGIYANFQCNGTNVGFVNCKVLDTEATYLGTTNNVGFAISGRTTTAFLTFDENDTLSVAHKYRGIQVEACTSCVITRPFLGLYHAQGLYYSPSAKGIKVIEPIVIGPFRQQFAPNGPDTSTHQEPTQVADPAGTPGFPYNDEEQVEDLEIYGLIAFPTPETNSGGRGIVMGNALGRVVCDGAFLGGWCADGFESYDFGAGSVFKRLIITRLRVGDETWANAINNETLVPDYDDAGAASKLTINAETLTVGATLTLDEAYVDNVIFVKGTDAYTALTIGPDVYSYARTPMAAGNGGQITAASLPASPNAGNANAVPNLAVPDPVGFAVADPKVSLEAYVNSINILTVTHKQIRDEFASRLNRPDNKGPFANTAGNPWRYSILPPVGASVTADSDTITADDDTITADAS